MRSGRMVAGLIALLLGCDDGPPPGPEVQPPPEWTASFTMEAEALEAVLAEAEPLPLGGLSVRLAFGQAADLDLYVTGPLEEAVYYANTPSAIGGALGEDRRCVHDAPRVETIRFEAPLMPGRYRVGVDYPHACIEAPAPAPFVVAVDEPGGSTSLRGLARYRVFEPIVLEIDVARTALEVK